MRIGWGNLYLFVGFAVNLNFPFLSPINDILVQQVCCAQVVRIWIFFISVYMCMVTQTSFPLQAKEVELLHINKLLEESDLSASTYRQWKENNEELVKEIERLAAHKSSEGAEGTTEQDTPIEEVALETVDKETTSSETEGAYRLSLSDGEQLVDAETSDVLLEIPLGSPSPSSVLELSLGSLQDSINEKLSEMVESGEAAENYFYI